MLRTVCLIVTMNACAAAQSPAVPNHQNQSQARVETPANERVQARAAVKPRARDLGIPFDGQPGPLNAITDVPASRSATRR